MKYNRYLFRILGGSHGIHLFLCFKSVVFLNFDLGMSKKTLFIYTPTPQYAI